MNPPFVATDNALASSSSSSSEELMKEQDHQNHNKSSSTSTSEESLSVPVDLSSSCSESSWLKKDMRGRKRIGEAGAADIAAQTLMRLHLYGNSRLRDRLPPHDEPTSEAVALLAVKKRKKNVMKNDVSGSTSSPAVKQKEKLEGRDGNEALEEKKKMNKKMKLGLEMIKSEEGEPLMIKTLKQEEVKPSQSHVCDVCNKSFTSFQALGGHKTKHRKNIVKSMKGKEVMEQRQEEEKVEEEDRICINGALSGEEAAALISSEKRLEINSNDNENNSKEEEVAGARQQSGSKIRDFDLNVPYVLELEATDI